MSAVFGKPQMNTLYLETLTLEVPFRYSSLPNRRAARNKRGGGENEPLLISVVPGIVVLGKMSHSLLAWCLE